MIDERTYQAAIDRIARLRAELARVRAERDRLFGCVVGLSQLSGFSRAFGIVAATDGLRNGRLRTGDVAAALAEHDKRQRGG